MLYPTTHPDASCACNSNDQGGLCNVVESCNNNGLCNNPVSCYFYSPGSLIQKIKE